MESLDESPWELLDRSQTFLAADGVEEVSDGFLQEQQDPLLAKRHFKWLVDIGHSRSYSRHSYLRECVLEKEGPKKALDFWEGLAITCQEAMEYAHDKRDFMKLFGGILVSAENIVCRIKKQMEVILTLKDYPFKSTKLIANDFNSSQFIQTDNVWNDVWVHKILPFLGPGHFLLLALANRKFKELYLAYFATIKNNAPNVKMLHHTEENEHRYYNGPKRGAVATDTFYSAAFSSARCADYYWGKTASGERLPFASVCATMAKHGNLEVIKWAWLEGFPWNAKACRKAALGGHLEVLKFLRETHCSWDAGTCGSAAKNGHLECLKYAHTNGCEWNEWTCARAAKNGQLECLQYAHTNGCEWNEWTFQCAAENGHLEVLKYLHEEQCPWNETTCSRAAGSGHLKCLQWLHEHHCPWNWEACTSAAENGHLDCLKYLHDNGCEWNGSTCHQAALNGQLDCLMYAREKGCLWDENTCHHAAKKGHLDCLQYAHLKGCPWSSTTYHLARLYGQYEIAEWAKKNGCPVED